jgi:hypothetical protein
VSKTYQQPALLALIVLNEVKRGLYGHFIWNLLDNGQLQIFIAFRDSPKELGQYLAVKFIARLQKCLEQSSDKMFQMMVLFTILCRKYRVFRQSVWHGDAIVVEALYKYFIPVWLMVGKQNYVEIGLSQIEDLYGPVSFHVLQSICKNRMLPLHPGTDCDGQKQADWAMDALMELLQTKYKTMNFLSTLEGWQNHSTNMPLVARAKKFAETEYTQRSNVKSFDEMYFETNAAGDKQDKGNCKTQTLVPRRTKEKIVISEIGTPLLFDL